MTGFSTLRGLVTGLAVLLAPVSAHAAPVNPDKQARGTARIINGIFIRKLQDLNFGTIGLITGGAGTATVNPNNDAITTTGGIMSMSGPIYSALFEAVSPSKSVVHIRVPKASTVVTRVGGTETMTVDNFTISGSANRNVVAKEPFSFSVGGTLRVKANQAEGLYVGTFDVDLQYN